MYGDSLCLFLLNISLVGECFMRAAMQFGKMKKEATILIVHIL